MVPFAAALAPEVGLDAGTVRRADVPGRLVDLVVEGLEGAALRAITDVRFSYRCEFLPKGWEKSRTVNLREAYLGS